MKKFILILIVFSTNISFSQTQEDLLKLGVNERTVKTIFKKFNGNVSDAINKWADSGNGKLSKDFVEAIKGLGFNDVYLDTKLKLARKQRLQQGILGALTVATGVALASSGGYPTGGDYMASNYLPTYYSDDYDYSKKKKKKRYQYDMTTLPDLTEYDYPSIEMNTYESYFDISTTVDVSDTSVNTTSFEAKTSEEMLRELGFYEQTNSNPVKVNQEIYNTPIIYGSSSNYVDGINQASSGFDETGLLNIYDSSGITTGAVKKTADGYAIFSNGNETSFVGNPDNEGVSTIYSGGIPIGAQKRDRDGNITYYKDGIVTGHSKKVRDGYENYDSSGIIQSFTATGKK